ncbi:MAG: carbohydrate ABC transporter permease [Spirochaetaceae bacterium]|jgi:putative aldouronate transport system permease protein|nr:carbohydrate ABC transporter permease [Spirochaetaceae bacterium]
MAGLKKGFLSNLFDVCNLIFFALLAFIMLLPFWNVLMISLTTQGDYFRRPLVLLPYNINIDSYRYLFKAPTIPRSYLMSAIITSGGTAFSILLTSMLAYPLSKKRLAGKKFFTLYLVFTMFFSGGLIPTYLLITTTLHLRNNLLALILPSGVSVWNFIIMRTFFMQLPESMEESARIDGANDFTILFNIIYPLSTAVLSTLALFVAVGFWNSWFNARLYLNDAKLFPLQLVLRNMVKDSSKPAELLIAASQMRDALGNPVSLFEDGLKMAMVVIAVVPMLLIYPFIQKFFEKGVMIGSIKG